MNKSRKERYEKAQEILIEIINILPKQGMSLCCVAGTLGELYGVASVANEVIDELIKQRDEAINEARKLRERKGKGAK